MESGNDVSLFLERLIKVSFERYLKLSGKSAILLLSDYSFCRSLRFPKFDGRAFISLLRMFNPSK